MTFDPSARIRKILEQLADGTFGLSALNSDLDTLLTRLSVARAGYLDELDFDLNARLGAPAGASLAADLLTIDNFVDNLESRLTSTRAGYLDQLDFGLQETIAALQTDLDNPAQYKADLTTLETRLSAARAGYLDQLDFNLKEAITATWIASDDLIISSDAESAMNSGTSPTKVKESQVLEGTFRVKFDLKDWSGVAARVDGQIYKNGVSYGTHRNTTSTTYVTFTEDLFFAAGDLVQIYIDRYGSGGIARAQNHRIYGKMNIFEVII